MILKSRLDKNTCNKLVEVYHKIKSDDFININHEIQDEIEEVFNSSGSMVIHDEHWTGFLILFHDDKIMYLNPWFFGGIPIVEEGNNPLSELLLREAINIHRSEGFYKTLLICRSNHMSFGIEKMILESGFSFSYDYADMQLDLNNQLYTAHPILEFAPVTKATVDELKACYKSAFDNGDAKFHVEQSEMERYRFWDMLGYETAKDNPCSYAVYKDEKLIGFSLVIDMGEQNKHASCMCILPDYSGRGYGRALVEKMIETAIKEGDKTFTLGTEKLMRAFKLYERNGFKVINVNRNYIMR